MDEEHVTITLLLIALISPFVAAENYSNRNSTLGAIFATVFVVDLIAVGIWALLVGS